MMNSLSLRWIPVLGFLLISPSAFGSGPAGPPTGTDAEETQGGLALSLREAILMAFRNHAEIQVALLEEAARGSDIAIARSPYDPRFTGGADYNKSDYPTDDTGIFGGNELGISQSERLSFRSEVSQRFFTGTRAAVSLTSNLNRGSIVFQGIEFGRRTELRPRIGLTLTQPLLRGISIQSNTADIRLAKNSYSMSGLDFRQLVDGILAEVERRYWEAVFTREYLSVREASLESAREILRISEARLRVGDVPRLEVITAQADVATQEEGIIRARNDLENARDRLAQIVLEPDWRQVGRRTLRPTDDPTLVEWELDQEASIRTALERRPDLEKSRRELEQVTIRHRRAKHELLPTLNLTGTVGSSGLGRAPGNAFSEMLSGEFLDWGVGLALEVPLGENRLARGNLNRLKYQKRQARIRLKDREAGILYEVRAAVRSVRSARERVRASEAARSLSERRLEVEQAKLSEGATIANAVLEAQEDLLAARSAEIRARIDYRLALSLLQKAESSLVDVHGIRIEKEEKE